jgi:hypothetical protein
MRCGAFKKRLCILFCLVAVLGAVGIESGKKFIAAIPVQGVFWLLKAV